MLDAREIDVGISEYVVGERLRVLFDQLGPKCGRNCAVIIPSGLGADQMRMFKERAVDFGLRLSLFNDEQLARDWLTGQRQDRVQHTLR